MSYFNDDNQRAEAIKKSGRNASWKDKNGKYTKVRYMTNEHILNLVKHLKGKEDYTSSTLWRTWVIVLDRELIRRRKEYRR